MGATWLDALMAMLIFVLLKMLFYFVVHEMLISYSFTGSS